MLEACYLFLTDLMSSKKTEYMIHTRELSSLAEGIVMHVKRCLRQSCL